MIHRDLDRIAGHTLAGGCDDCHAFQRLERDAFGVYVLRIHHDDTCPLYASRQQR